MPSSGDDGGVLVFIQRRLKKFAGSAVRQLPCLHVVQRKLRCLKRGRYQSLDEDDEGGGAGVEDQRQNLNRVVGQALVKGAMAIMVCVTVLLMYRSAQFDDLDPLVKPVSITDRIAAFKRDSPLVLYIAAIEILVCGACSHTAATMYQRRRHSLQHPADAPEKHRKIYAQVHLEKEPGQEESQLFGLGFRPSTDGFEGIVVEAVRPGSLLDVWCARQVNPTPQDLVEQALGDGADEPGASGAGGSSAGSAGVPPGAEGMANGLPRRAPVQVQAGAAIVAVNDVSGDVGMMQLQLTKSKVTLWVRSEFTHPSEFESEILAGQPVAGAPSAPDPQQLSGAAGAAAGVAGSPVAPPGPSTIGRANLEPGSSATDPQPEGPQPRCACMAFEDEEPQHLTRWCACAIILGWVTMLPVLLMQPHEERPRQQLFRQYLLKPCVLILPVWMLLWLLDCVEVLFVLDIVHPVYYFGIAHMALPAVLVWYLFQMQAADERLVLEQRRSRAPEAFCGVPVVVEDPCPTLLKELLVTNPVVLICMGSCAAIPVLLSNLLTPLKTERGQMAQSHINIVYFPMILFQFGFLTILSSVDFLDLPTFYLEGVVYLVSAPCLFTWCCCIALMSKYGRADLDLVQRQRLQRGTEAVKNPGQGGNTPTLSPPADASLPAGAPSANGIVDCTEAMHREYELIYTA